MNNKTVSKESLLPPMWVLVAALLFVVGWLLVQLKELVTLLVLGFSISYVIEPALVFMEKRGIRRPLGIFTILFGVTLLILLLFITAIPTVVREYSELAQNLPGYVDKAKAVIGELLGKLRAVVPADKLPIDEWLASPLDLVSSVGKNALPKVAGALTAALGKGYSVTMTLVNAALLPFIVFYISVDFPSIGGQMLGLIPLKPRKKVSSMLQEMDGYVSAFVRGQLIVCSIMVVMYAIGLGLIGVELWFLLAVIAGFGNMVPYLGTLVGILLASIMALVTFGSFSKLVIVWVLFAIVQFTEGTFITPRIQGERVGLSPLMIILALLAGGTLFGLLGVFLAIPGAAIGRVLVTHFHEWLLKRV